MDEVAAEWLLDRGCPHRARGLEDGCVGGEEAMELLCWGLGHRWEELHTLASEPRERHVLLAEQVEDAANGLFSTLSRSAICTITSPGKTFQVGTCPYGMRRVASGKRFGLRSLTREGGQRCWGAGGA